VTPAVASFLRNLLAAQQINCSDPNFAATAVLVVQSLDQLDQIITTQETTP